MALALILLVGSALLIRTSLALRAVNPGYDAQQRADDAHVADGLALPPVRRRRSDGSRRPRSSAGAARESSSPARRVVCRWREAMAFPSTSWGARRGRIRSTAAAAGLRSRPATSRSSRSRSGAGGRSPTGTRRERLPSSIINEAMARQFWKDGDPLNDRLVIGRGVMREFADEPERQIIGVVARFARRRIERRSRPEDVHSAGAGPRSRECAECPHHADGVGRANARAAAFGQHRRPGTAPPGERPARVGCALDGRRSCHARPRASASTCC